MVAAGWEWVKKKIEGEDGNNLNTNDKAKYKYNVNPSFLCAKDKCFGWG